MSPPTRKHRQTYNSRRAGLIPPYREVLAQRRDRVLAYYRSGLSAYQVAALVSVTPQTVYNDLKALREPLRGD